MLPSFDIEGGLWLALVRSVSVAAQLSVFGTLVFRNIVAPRAFAKMPPETIVRIKTRLHLVSHFSVAMGVLAMVAWLLLQAADMASAGTAAQALAAVPTVLTDTAFGHLIILQLVTLAGVAVAIGRGDHRLRQRVGLALAGLVVALQAGHSHAASMYSGPSILLGSQILHLLSAGAWLGGLLPLLVLVREASPKAGAIASRWFSPMGKLCIVTLTVSSAFQGWVMVASIPGLVGTSYGWMVLAKLALFGVLFAFAVANRYRFAPALVLGDPATAKRTLVRSIAVQTGFGLAIVAAAGVLSSLVPAMHAQPLWPFADRFTVDTIGEDPDFRNEVVGAVLALAGAVVLLVVGVLVRRRVRWFAFAGAAVIAWFAIPHLDLLFVPAYPTSYYRSPTGFTAVAILQGEALYPGHCSACHGAQGRGDGPAANGLADPPADLTATHLWMHSDGELFWWLSHGIEGPEGGLAMPGFAAALTEDDRWDLIDFIRARNAGLAFRASGAWPVPLQAPDLQVQCAGGRTASLADLRGGFVRLVIGMASSAAQTGVTTIMATADPTARPASGVCIAHGDEVLRAYALIAGLQLNELPGTQFLIDGEGWLRAVQHPGAGTNWDDPHALSAEIHDLDSHPIAASPGMDHDHMQM